MEKLKGMKFTHEDIKQYKEDGSASIIYDFVVEQGGTWVNKCVDCGKEHELDFEEISTEQCIDCWDADEDKDFIFDINAD